MESDNQLLAEYVERGSERAFRELVQRHIKGRDECFAEDVTQEVFTTLARRAAALASHPALASWLYVSVRLSGASKPEVLCRLL
jgi:DNA-directed RNA polymerase specialized sigma24 family protein